MYNEIRHHKSKIDGLGKDRITFCDMVRSWRLAGLVLVCGAVVAGLRLSGHSLGSGITVFLVFIVFAGLASPLAFPRSLAAAQAQRRSADDGRPIVYWRPGCPYCLRLRATLGRHARRAHWVDIWSDPAGAAAVRAVTGGDETVPTVVVAGEGFVNPDPAWLRDLLRTR